jgi:hypothetical protein
MNTCVESGLCGIRLDGGWPRFARLEKRFENYLARATDIHGKKQRNLIVWIGCWALMERKRAGP